MSGLLKKDWLGTVHAAVSSKKDHEVAVARESIGTDEKDGARVSGAADSDASNSTPPSEEVIDEEVQEGVAKQEAIALTWNKSTLVLVFLL
jgi:hypothetical protein